MTEAALQRDYRLREVFNALRWRMIPHDLPPPVVDRLPTNAAVAESRSV
jgi:hypothetical protein